MKKILTGDKVVVIAGKDKGKQGTLTKLLNNDKALVSGVKIIKKHTKANPQLGIEGGIIEKESPISISNLMVFNPSTKKGEKIGIKTLEDGKKIRIFKSTGGEVK
ncbi:MAG: 50S ribosomal protein L24 [SAR86 cluster bacterium]|jgi:large subunit ribosomal protein L24|nr:50S ribosomal protein L24 [SAR86 cluster bacterium]|tara:strand:+ start:11808 stop:12122 length:315 start_codon:yes stop_codon:yes gene_type:complete